MSATAVKVQCPSCAATLRTRSGSTAQSVKCPRCQHIFSLARAIAAQAESLPDAASQHPDATLSLPGKTGRAATSTGIAEKPSQDQTLNLPGDEDDERDPTINEVPHRTHRPVDQGETIELGTRTLHDGEENDGIAAEPNKTLQHKPRKNHKAAAPINDDDEPVVDAEFDDGDEDEDEPLGRTKKLPRKQKRREESNNTKLLVIVGVAALLLGGGLVAAIMLLSKENDPPKPNTPPIAQLPPGPGPIVDPTKDRKPAVPVDDKNRLLPPAPANPGLGTKVNSRAPEISGEDLNGFAFNLSDFRGKVVLLDFWGDWCPYCRYCYPTEKELVLKMAGRPFTMLGVNVDPSKAAARRAVQQHGLNWASWFDGSGGPICKQWQIKSFPNVFLIDHNGVIRKKVVGFKESDLKLLMREVEELVHDAEAATKK